MSDELDFSKPEELQTRDGRAVRIYATDGGGVFPIHGAIKAGDGWYSRRWVANGFLCMSGALHASDLTRKPRRVTGWVNVYPGGVLSKLSEDRVEASKHRGSSCIGQIYIDAEIQT